MGKMCGGRYRRREVTGKSHPIEIATRQHPHGWHDMGYIGLLAALLPPDAVEVDATAAVLAPTPARYMSLLC